MDTNCNVARHLREAALRTPDACAALVPAPVPLWQKIFGLRGQRDSKKISYHSRTFAQLEHESDAAATLFARNGIAAGTKTLLMARPGLDLILSMFALLKLGAVPVAIDPGMGWRKFLRCVENTAPTALVGIPAAHLLACVFPKTFRCAASRVVIGTETFARVLRETITPERRPLFVATANDPAAILFTSGSTGAPKGVRQTHGALEAQLAFVRDIYRIHSGDTDFPLLPVFALFNPALAATTVTPNMNPSRPAAADPATLVRAIRQNAVTRSFGSPALWSKIARHCKATGVSLPTLRLVLVAGAPVSAGLLRLLREVLPNAEIHTPYGATEVLPVANIEATEVLGETWAETARGGGTCVGKPLPGVAVKIIAATDAPLPSLADATELPIGEIGEIIVASPACSREYDNAPEANALAKIAGVAGGFWHRMGDMGRLDSTGRLWFYGRKAEVVRTATGQLYTESCEAIFNAHPRVFRTALIGLGEPGQQEPALVVEPFPCDFPRTAAQREHFIAELREIAATLPTHPSDTHSAAQRTTLPVALPARHSAAPLAPLPVALPAAHSISRFFFEKKFPVDPRHNAKIHRLSLREKWAKLTSPRTA